MNNNSPKLDTRILNIKKLEEDANFYPEPTDLRVSTMTAVAKTNLNINLKKMFETKRLELKLISEECQKEGVLNIKYGNVLKIKNNISQSVINSINIKKMFYNQITVIVLMKKDQFFKKVNMAIGIVKTGYVCKFFTPRL